MSAAAAGKPNVAGEREGRHSANTPARGVKACGVAVRTIANAKRRLALNAWPKCRLEKRNASPQGRQRERSQTSPKYEATLKLSRSNHS